MSIRSALAGITLTSDDKTGSISGPGADIVGMMPLADLKLAELSALLKQIKALLTANSDSSNATTVQTQITAIG